MADLGSCRYSQTIYFVLKILVLFSCFSYITDLVTVSIFATKNYFQNFNKGKG